MEGKRIDLSEFAHSNFVNKSNLYRHGAYHQVSHLRRNLRDYGTHLFAFLIDLNICLLPVYIWVLEFLLILCGLIPPDFSIYYFILCMHCYLSLVFLFWESLQLIPMDKALVAI